MISMEQRSKEARKEHIEGRREIKTMEHGRKEGREEGRK